MDDVAGQLERIVHLMQANPITSALAVLAVLLIMGFRKEGVLPKLLELLSDRVKRDTALEDRRIKMMLMIENRPQALLPGLEEDR